MTEKKKKYRRMTKAHLAYNSKRQALFLKFIREKRGLSYAQADKLLDFYKGWTKRMEKTGTGNYYASKIFGAHLKYKITSEEPSEFLRKYPRNKKYRQRGY